MIDQAQWFVLQQTLHQAIYRRRARRAVVFQRPGCGCATQSPWRQAHSEALTRQGCRARLPGKADRDVFYLRYNLATVNFEILEEIREVETIASSASIRDLARLRKVYGPGRWRKVKGIAYVRLGSGRVRLAELHWYEAHGIGKKDFKRKRYLD